MLKPTARPSQDDEQGSVQLPPKLIHKLPEIVRIIFDDLPRLFQSLEPALLDLFFDAGLDLVIDITDGQQALEQAHLRCSTFPRAQ